MYRELLAIPAHARESQRTRCLLGTRIQMRRINAPRLCRIANGLLGFEMTLCVNMFPTSPIPLSDTVRRYMPPVKRLLRSVIWRSQFQASCLWSLPSRKSIGISLRSTVSENERFDEGVLRDSRSLSTSVKSISANGGSRCILQIETKAADKRINGMMILNMRRADMMAG